MGFLVGAIVTLTVSELFTKKYLHQDLAFKYFTYTFIISIPLSVLITMLIVK